MPFVAELVQLLRPAGQGLFLVSTGRDRQLALSRRIYGAESDAEVETRWQLALSRLADAKVVMLGVPSDVGAGFRRGASLAPGVLREALLDAVPDLRERGVVDAGDVFVVPQLLHDDMLSSAQLAATRRAIYGDPRAPHPVSPLSIEERAIELILAIAPRAKLLVLGGDHSVAWPVTAALHRARPGFCIVQPDAHTDLLQERLGVKYCFATWSFHANELLGRDGRLVQVGVRASRKPREHWESTLGVRQFWGDSCVRDPEGTLAAILAHVRSLGSNGVYFSNDIDGTDAAWADATGTPESGGPSPEFFERLIAELGRDPGIVAADLVEVAPEVSAASGSAARTIETSVRYLRATLDALLRG